MSVNNEDTDKVLDEQQHPSNDDGAKEEEVTVEKEAPNGVEQGENSKPTAEPLSPPVPSPTIHEKKENDKEVKENGNGEKKEEITKTEEEVITVVSTSHDEEKGGEDDDVKMNEAEEEAGNESNGSEKHELTEANDEQPAKKLKIEEEDTKVETTEQEDSVMEETAASIEIKEEVQQQPAGGDDEEKPEEASKTSAAATEESKPEENQENKPDASSSTTETSDPTTTAAPPPKMEEEGEEEGQQQKAADPSTPPPPPKKDLDPPEGTEEGQALPKHQSKFIVNTIRSVKRLKDAGPFLKPVDTVKLNVPTYYDVVTNPIDLGGMEKKAQKGEYTKVSQFVDDMDLLVYNCELFNGHDAPISAMARNIKTSFGRYMANAPPYNLPPEQQGKNKRKSFPPPPASTPKSQRVAAAAATAANAAAQNPSLNNHHNNNNKSPNEKTTTSVASNDSNAGIVSADATNTNENDTNNNKPFALQPSGIPTIRRDSAVDGRPKREIHPPKPKDLMYGDVKPRKKKFAAELKFCGQVLKELTSKKHEAYSFPFLQPVDPVALNCPSYFKIIKQPMDMSTIQQKYSNNQYETADEFAADIKLMFKNCYKFNPEGSPVNVMGHKLEAVFDKKWQDKPIPAPTPPPPDSSDEGSDIEFSEEMSNPAIKFLEEQLERMRDELIKLKRDAIKEYKRNNGGRNSNNNTNRRKSNKGTKTTSGGDNRRKSGGGRRESSIGNSQPVTVTYDMKKELSEKISNLPDKKLRHVVNIIHESMPQLKNSEEDEIELDMDQLDPETLMKLYNYVVNKKDEKKTAKKAAAAAAAAAAGGGSNSGSVNNKTKKKSKPLSEAEQSRQIMQIQEKIQQFDQAGKTTTGGKTPAATAAAAAGSGTLPGQQSDDDSSSDDDDDDENNNNNNNDSSDDSSSEEE